MKFKLSKNKNYEIKSMQNTEIYTNIIVIA